MFLFIFESIGTSELLLVGIVALIFLGPRKLPEMAKKAGKIMAEFRGTANEFKQTWEREVNFEQEAKSLSLIDLEAEAESEAVSRSERKPATDAAETSAVTAPEIKAADPGSFEHLRPTESATPEIAAPAETAELNDKKNWL